jgi:hypothetical protein
MSSVKPFSFSMLRGLLLAAGTALVSVSSFAQAIAPPQDSGAARVAPVAKSYDEALNFAIAKENRLDQKLHGMQPLIETYVQQMQRDQALGSVPKSDNYFLGKLDLSNGVNHDSYMREPGFISRSLDSLTRVKSSRFLARGFAQMVIMDDGGFDRSHYRFQFVRREMLGEVRCLVYDVRPLNDAGPGRFIGRIWVEDQEYNVVRFNGTYGPSTRNTHYTHFDSWRVNCAPHTWLPAYIYSEEASLLTNPGVRPVTFKAQVRLWGYQSKSERQREEFTNITVDSPQGVNDKSEQAADTAPVESIRMWQRQAEDNLLDRLTEGGMLAPVGEVDKVLQTVLENLEITNNISLQPEIRARVMMTTPMESVYVGHTIVISRGLLDVLPDEATLAAVMAHQLGHIVLGHQMDTAFAFSDRTAFEDDQTLHRVYLARSESEENDADQKALELLKKSPYADKLPKVGLFLRMLAERGGELPHLISPLLGNGLVADSKEVRLAALLQNAPEIQMNRVDQIPALPLGARIKVNPWNNQLSLLKTRNVPPVSGSEKLPFEITPVFLHLTRYAETAQNAQTPGPDQTQPASTSQLRAPRVQ